MLSVNLSTWVQCQSVGLYRQGKLANEIYLRVRERTGREPACSAKALRAARR